MIAVIDYGAGNIRSVIRALAALGISGKVTQAPGDILKAKAVILPGVGAAGDCVKSLRALGLDDAIRETVEKQRPFLGVCLGLQILFDATEEGGIQPCLGLLRGSVKKLPPGLKVPHMGWNQVRQVPELSPYPIFSGIPQDTSFYFVHSYYAQAEDPSLVIGETDYGVTFCSALARGNLVATQFHPEKSGALGLRIYQNFLTYFVGEETVHSLPVGK